MTGEHDYRGGLDRCTCGRIGLDHWPWEYSTRPAVPLSAIDRAAAEAARREWEATR